MVDKVSHPFDNKFFPMARQMPRHDLDLAGPRNIIGIPDPEFRIKNPRIRIGKKFLRIHNNEQQ
jgi:hypothetical protein